ncbi:MAG: hypothetical protein JKY03_02170 [Aureispira sp.]|nr:hypothetical protein [Aureispira sp.]
MKYAPAERYQQDIKQQKFLIKAILICLCFSFLLLPIFLIFPLLATLWIMQFFYAVCDYFTYKDQRHLNYILLTLGYFIGLSLISTFLPLINGSFLYQCFLFIMPLALILKFYLMTLDDLQAVKGVRNLGQKDKEKINPQFNEDLLDDTMI